MDKQKPTQEEINQIIENHKIWLATESKEGDKADFSDMVLEGFEFESVNLKNVAFLNTKIVGCKFNDTILSRAVLDGVELLGSVFVNTDLSEAKIRGANLVGGVFRNCKFIKTDFSISKMARMDFSDMELSYCNFTGVDLEAAKLKNSVLHDSNFKEAILTGANFEGATLFGCIFEKAILIGAYLSGASLQKANFENAEIWGAVLREANLGHAVLSGAIGIRVEQLAGTDVTGTELPKKIETFLQKTRIVEISKKAGKLYAMLMTGCLYAVLTLATSSGDRVIKLPILNSTVKLTFFYIVAPVLFLFIFVYFQIYLQRLWENMASRPAVFPDGAPADIKAYPWLVLGFARSHIALISKRKLPLSRLQYISSLVTAWWVVPGTLFAFWSYYIHLFPKPIPAYYLLLIFALSLFFALYSLLLSRRTLRLENTNSGNEWGRKPKMPVRYVVGYGAGALLVVAMTIYTYLGVMLN